MREAGELLRRARREAGLTQAQLARRAGLSIDGVSLIERGRRAPRLSTLMMLADAMALSDGDRRRLMRAAQRSDEAAPGGALPTWPDAIVGRDHELAAVSRLLADGARLVTVTGTGGCGKSRLAAEVARRTASDHEEGARWLDAAQIRDPDGWYAGMANALGCGGAGNLEAVVSFLADRHLLVVLDHAEHELDRCRVLLRATHEWAPHVQVLVTSRLPVRLPQEQVYRLGPLALAQAVPRTAHDLQSTPAAALFLRKAVRPPDLALSTEDIVAVDQICRQVDGLPLALELIAGYSDVVALPELAESLTTALSEPSSIDPEAELTLRARLVEAVIGWSHDALPDAQREYFAKLSVFAGSFCEWDAQHILGLTAPETRDVLSALMASSLVFRAADLDGLALFRMLHLVRSVAAERLTSRPDAEETHRRHAEHLTAFVEAAAEQLASPEAPLWLRGLDVAAEDCDRAVAWSARHEPAFALRLAGSVYQWCYLRGRYAQGRAWAAEALTADDERGSPGDERSAHRIRALSVLGGLAFLECDYDAAATALDTCRGLCRHHGDATGEGWALGRLGGIARERGQYARAVRLHQQALTQAVADGNLGEQCSQLNWIALARWLSGDVHGADSASDEAERRAVLPSLWEPSIWAALNHGAVSRLRGRLAEADAVLAHAHSLSEEHAFPEGVAWALNQRGVVSRLRGDHDRARRQQEAAILEHRRLGDRWREASGLDELALLAVLSGNLDTAALHLGHADHLRTQIGAPTPPVEREVREHVLEALAGGSSPVG